MNIKDFKAGEKAYLIASRQGRKSVLKEVEIEKIGRKFVYIKRGYYGFYQRNEGDNYLVENKDWGCPDMLFLTRQDAEDEIEFSVLLTSIIGNSKYGRLSKLTLDQLRRIERIFEEGTNGDKEAAAAH